MTIAIDLGCKATKQTNKTYKGIITAAMVEVNGGMVCFNHMELAIIMFP